MLDGVIIHSHTQPIAKEHFHNTQFSSDNDIIKSVKDFLKKEDELFHKTGKQKQHR